MSSQITLPNGSTFTLIQMPSSPGVTDFNLLRKNNVAYVPSPFVPGVNQTFIWPGANCWALQFNLPKMRRFESAPWEGFISELNGIANVFVFTIPGERATPQGVADGAPVCATVAGANNQTSAMSLVTSGWTPNVFGQLLPGDYFNVGPRLYVVCEQVNSDSNGNATISIWPSLRESPATGAPLVLSNPGVLMRLANNDIAMHTDYTGLSMLSVSTIEVR
jgi:hypothetical protein